LVREPGNVEQPMDERAQRQSAPRARKTRETPSMIMGAGFAGYLAIETWMGSGVGVVAGIVLGLGVWLFPKLLDNE
jgi:hypothetical protein